jgi:serine/threonine protein kinase
LARKGAFAETQVRDVLNNLLPVLQFVHQHHVIHRHIKLENIIRRNRDKQLFLVDFGASKVATGTALARTETVIGSVGYIAPEQSIGKAVFASDIYSLNISLKSAELALSNSDFLKAVQSLRKRGLIEKITDNGSSLFAVQALVKAYVKEI